MFVEDEDEIIIDENPQEYSIRVYQFNTQTGKGGCFVQYNNDILDKVILHVHGRNNYENTDFTHSMDEGRIITVYGIGNKINGRLKKLDIDIAN